MRPVGYVNTEALLVTNSTVRKIQDKDMLRTLPSTCYPIAVRVWAQEDIASSHARGGLGWMAERISSWQGLSDIEMAAQGGGGAIIPGGVQKQLDMILSAMV